LRDPEHQHRTPWLRIFWIVVGLLVGLTVISVVTIQTLGPGVMLISA
jgi:uncharacterized membrane protein